MSEHEIEDLGHEDCTICDEARRDELKRLRAMRVRIADLGCQAVDDDKRPCGLCAPCVAMGEGGDTLPVAVQEMCDAAYWVLNTVSGVGKDGGAPSPEEVRAAFGALDAARAKVQGKEQK